MGQTTRTTKLLLDLSTREQGGTNSGKRSHLTETVIILNAARLPDWNFSHAFPDLPNRYRRSVIKDVIGKARGYLTSVTNWHASGKKKGKPGIPTASNHPTLYAGTFSLELDELDLRKSFVRLKVYTGSQWVWVHYPTCYNRYFERRRAEIGWGTESPQLLLGKQTAAIHFLQTKTITAKKIVESKREPDLVTVAVDLNVKRAPRNWHGTLPEAGGDSSLVGWRPAPTGLFATRVASGEATRGKTAPRTMWVTAENSLCCWPASER